jgi:hypothetical protein
VIESSNEKNRPRQFSLRELLWFFAACSAVFAMFSMAPQLFADPLIFVSWRCLITMFTSWGVLLLFLCTKKDRGMLVIHCAGPLLALLWLFGPRKADFNQFYLHSTIRQVFELVAFGCFVSSLASFLLSVIVMINGAVRRK